MLWKISSQSVKRFRFYRPVRFLPNFYPNYSLSGQWIVGLTWNCTASSITIIYLWSKFQVHTIFQSWDIQIQGIFGQKRAKMPILGRSAKYTWVTGGKIDPTPLNYKSYAVRRQKMSQKYWSEKKLEGVSILGVVKKWWRHHGSMTSPMMTKLYNIHGI